MTVNYEKHVQTLAKLFKQVFGEMTSKQTESYMLKATKGSEASDYAVGIAVPYKDEKSDLSGEFILGLADKKKAILMASAIAENTGLPAISEFDDMAADVLFEFINTVVGQTITAWDKLGLSIEFDTPFSLEGEKIEKALNVTCESYIITLSISGESIAMFLTFEETANNMLKGKKVLVVDDSRMIRLILLKGFNKQDCSVVEAADGKEAVEKFREIKPDLTIMDMVMPNMNGLEAISEIRKIAPEAKIIVLTSTAKKSEVVSAATLGIRGYAIKPIKMEKLIELATSCFD